MSHCTNSTEQINLPVIPLRGMVAFPSIPMSIEVARDKSIHAIRAAERLGGCIMLIAQKDISIEKPSPDDLFKVGTIAKIKQSVKTSEGNIRVILEGKSRATVLQYTDNDRYLSAFVSSAETAESEDSAYSEALVRQAFSALERVTSLMPKISDEMLYSVKTIQNPGLLADFIAANILIRFEDKQEVLEELDPIVRLAEILAMLEREEQILRCEMDIHKKVRAKLDDNQRDFYLREQIKVIQNELGDDAQSEVDEFFDRIDDAHLPKEIEDKLIKETTRLAKTPYGSAESTVLHNYLEECLDIPFGKYTETVCDIAKAKEILERDHDGMNDVKERIIEFLASTQFSGKKGGQIICLVGPPGVGKTSIAASIAESLGRKYIRVSLGGVRDESDIRGHRKTYVGAMPGRIVAALQKVGVMNPLILLDEIDKLTCDAHGDPSSALLEVLDSEQNKSFRDHFVEMPIDLSECVFIATANTLETVSRPLIDRMEVIEISAYTRTEKLKIAKNHLIPKQLKAHGLTKKQLSISQSAIAEIIDYYTSEAGVRNLEREIASLCRKATKALIESAEKVSIKASDIKNYLGARKCIPEKLSDIDEIGVVNGLAYTSVGGDMLKIEVAVLDGSGKIELTGSLGDVMKESAQLAVSYVRSIAQNYGIDPEFHKNKDIHIHFPEGAVPKDGPSAGVTIVTALVSALSGTPVKRDVAMTGELSLRGKTLAIGGLKEKTMAAYTCGIKTVLIPADNVKDLERIDEEAREHLTFIPCKTLDEVLENALVKKSTVKKTSIKITTDKKGSIKKVATEKRIRTSV
ncbi:MAG: endopeptidase La [Ruminococcaceae bacterium]|nr:endopeptidase La [Oscillospiraceae bacterium]